MVERVVKAARRAHELYRNIKILCDGVANHAHERDDATARSNQEHRPPVISRPGETSYRTTYVDTVPYAEIANQTR